VVHTPLVAADSIDNGPEPIGDIHQRLREAPHAYVGDLVTLVERCRQQDLEASHLHG
jgi:hypothetical protein